MIWIGRLYNTRESENQRKNSQATSKGTIANYDPLKMTDLSKWGLQKLFLMQDNKGMEFIA